MLEPLILSAIAGLTFLAAFNALMAGGGRAEACVMDRRLCAFASEQLTVASEQSEEIGLFLVTALKLGKRVKDLRHARPFFDLINRVQDPSKTGALLAAASMDDLISADDMRTISAGSAIMLELALLPSVFSMGLWSLLAIGGGLVLGAKIPGLIVSSKAEARKAGVRKALLDAVDLMAIGVQAGMSLDKAMRVYAGRFCNPLAAEFERAFVQIDVGKTRREAFTSLAERSDVDDLKILISSVLQAEKLGTPLSRLLAEQSRDMKTRHRQWAREAAAKAPVKMLFPLVGLILPGLFIVLLGPLLLKFFEIAN